MTWTARLLTCNGFLLTWVVVWTPKEMMWNARILTCNSFLLTWGVVCTPFKNDVDCKTSDVCFFLADVDSALWKIPRGMLDFGDVKCVSANLGSP